MDNNFCTFNEDEFLKPPLITLCTLSFLPDDRNLYHGAGFSILGAITGNGSHFVFFETRLKDDSSQQSELGKYNYVGSNLISLPQLLWEFRMRYTHIG